MYVQNGLVVLAHFLAINVHATTGNSIAILRRQSQELNEAWEAKLPLPATGQRGGTLAGEACAAAA